MTPEDSYASNDAASAAHILTSSIPPSYIEAVLYYREKTLLEVQEFLVSVAIVPV